MRGLKALLICVWVAGCATPDAYVGRSVSALTAQFGAPAAEYRNSDGSRVLVYPWSPLGKATYMADVGPEGTVRSVRQVLNDASFQAIEPGMGRDEVLRLIGPPTATMAFPRRAQVAWEYLFRDTFGLSKFHVTFDSRGVVVQKLTERLDNDRDLGH